jgi:hypothetical protein
LVCVSFVKSFWNIRGEETETTARMEGWAEK